MTNSATAVHSMNSHEGMYHTIYSLTSGSKCSDDPNARAEASGNASIAPTTTTATTVTNSMARVTLTRAASTCPRASRSDDTTEQPIPTISPTPVSSISTGTTMFTAAIPSLPTLWPMNIPSMAVMADIPSIPSNVGKNTRLNNEDTFALPKSISFSFITCHLSLNNRPSAEQAEWRTKRPVSPSHLIRHSALR